MEVIDQIANEIAAEESGEQSNDALSNDSGESVQDPGQPSIPYDRFSEVVQQKNEYKERADRLESALLQFSNSQSSKSPEESSDRLPEFQTAEELVSYLNKRTTDQLEKAIEPIKSHFMENNYKANLDRFFSENQGAKSVLPEMDAYVDKLSSSRKSVIVNSVLAGDYSAVNEIYYTVMAQKNSNIQSIVDKSVSDETKKIVNPAQYRTARTTDPSRDDLFNQGKKTGNFRPFLTEFANSMNL